MRALFSILVLCLTTCFGAPDYLTVNLLNQSGYTDDQVYIVITARDEAGNLQWGQIDTGTGIVTGVNATGNSKTYSVSLHNLHSLQIPKLFSGLIWFSINNKLDFDAGTQPNPLSSGDPNYLTNYDIIEFTFNPDHPTSDQAVQADATAVSFFSIPLHISLSNAHSLSKETGLTQSRSEIMSRAASVFSSASSPENVQWNKLFLRNNGNILRLMSPGKSMSFPSFDPNYLDNEPAYDYSYISNIWTGANAFYRQHATLNIAAKLPLAPITYNYTGQVQPDNTFLFTSSNGGPQIIFLAPVTGPVQTETTTYRIFSSLSLSGSRPVAGSAEDVVTRLFEGAIITGLLPLPPGQTLSLDYLQSNQSNYYQNNPFLRHGNGKSILNPSFTSDDLLTFYADFICQQKDVLSTVALTPSCALSSSGSNTSSSSRLIGGPWYDLYSKALHSLGYIYTTGYDDSLWPQVLVSGPYDKDVPLIITIGSVN